MKNNREFSLRIGAILIGLVCAAAIISLFYTPYDPYAIDSAHRFLPPSPQHWFGTDNFGRDNFSRAVTGARYSLLVACSTVGISSFFGIILGLLSGYVGGFLDEIILRLTDALSAFPAVLTALVTVTLFNGNKFAIIPALAIAFLPSFIRITRSSAMRLKNQDFILSAYALGASKARIMVRHLLPNLLPTLIPAIVIGLSNAILAESGMSYLGLGIQPPIPSWGRMLFEGQSYLFQAPWETLSAGFMMILTVLGFHMLGEGLEQSR
ncbi:MAG: putative D,D-dipeptide transport system permease protein DdpC [Oscillospiraceae bacterium]|jgi:peptide/nickel transport system permease protein